MATPVIRKIALSDLVLDPAFQQRCGGLNADAVRDYMEAIDRLPPPTVFFDEAAECYWLPGGFHRFEAHRLAGREEMACEVRKGDRLDALRWSFGENAEHGLRRTNADKRKAVASALRLSESEHLEWSNREIARMCRVGHQLVNDVVDTRHAREGLAEKPIPPGEVARSSPPNLRPPNLDLAQVEGWADIDRAERAGTDPIPAARAMLSQALEMAARSLVVLGLGDAQAENLKRLAHAVRAVWARPK